MTRAQFLNNMYRRLCGNGMDRDQAEQHLVYYAEMLADRMEEGMTEEEAVAGMEDLETIVRRILEEEGLPYRSPEETVRPPEYPDVTRLGGGGGTRAYQVPKKKDWQKTVQIVLWVLAIVLAVSAIGRWVFMRSFGRYGYGSNTTTAVDHAQSPIPVEEVAPYSDRYFSEYGYYEDYGLTVPYEYGYEYENGTTSSPGSTLKKLDIEWAAGTVFVQSWNEDEIKIQEFSRSELNTRDMMVVEDTGDELTIRYRSGMVLGSVKGDKWLTVMVPDRIVEELEITTVSANVQLIGLEQGGVEVFTTSGDIDLTGCYLQGAGLATISGTVSLTGLHAEKLDISTTSGYVSGEAYCVDVEMETISGDVNLFTGDNTEQVDVSTTSGDVWCSVINTAVRSIEVSATSGDVSLSLPWDVGFTLDYSTISGSLDTGFDTVRQDGKVVYDGGGYEIDVETVSGDLHMY